MIEVLLDNRNANGGDGTIQVRHLLGASIPIAPVSGTIIDPAGGIIPVAFDSNTSFSGALPLDINGKVIYGNYTVNLTLEGVTYQGVFELCDRRASDYQLSAEIQCLLGIAEIKDGGKYPAAATINRTFRIRRAAVMSFEEEARDQTYDTINRSRQRIEVAYGGVDYTFDVSGRVEWIGNDVANLQFVELFQTNNITKLADCRRSLCIAADCLDRFVQTRINHAVSCGSGIASTDMTSITAAQTLFTRLQVAIKCYDVVGAGEMYAELEKVIGKCVCADCGDNRVTRIGYDVSIGLADNRGVYSITSGGTSTNVIEDSTGNFTISNSEALDEVSSAFIDRGDNLDLGLTPESWTNASLRSDFDTQNGTPTRVAYRKLDALGGMVQVNGYVNSETAIYNVPVLLTETALPAAYRPQQDTLPFPLWDEDLNIVGYARVLTSGHIQVETETPVPGGPVPAEDYRYSFTLNYDPSY